MEDLIQQFDQQVEAFRSEIIKFNSKGNKAAGVRARKALQDIKNTSQELRKAVTEKTNSL